MLEVGQKYQTRSGLEVILTLGGLDIGSYKEPLFLGIIPKGQKGRDKDVLAFYSPSGRSTMDTSYDLMIDQDPLSDLRQLKQDDPVVVIDNKSKRIILAHLHGFTEEGEVYVFKNGKTSFSSLRDKDPVQSVSLDEFTILPADDKTIPFLFLAETFGPLFTGIPKSHIKP